MPSVLYLIDGHALAYRTFFALTAGGRGERLQTASGEPTAGIFGFTSVLLRLLEQEKPEFLAVAFDTGKTFRDDLYPQYKATRAKMPDDLRPQMERIRQVVDAFGFPRLEAEGFEADDVLGSVARQAVDRGFGVKIITGDRDLLQLVESRILVNLPGGKLSDAHDYNAADVEAYLGIPPDQVIEYKALVGDKSDNIPGVLGIGEKTAIALLREFRTIDGIYAHLDELPQKQREKLTAGRDNAFLSRTLATIRTDLNLPVNLEDARTNHIDFQALEELFRELEFRTLLPRLHNLAGDSSESPRVQLRLFEAATPMQAGSEDGYHPETVVVDSPEKLESLLEAIRNATQLAVDTETTGTDPLRSSLVGISLAVREGEGWYIPVGHHADEPQLPLRAVVQALSAPFSDPALGKVGQNLKYDLLVLKQAGLELSPLVFDTMLAEWLIEPTGRSLGLKDMASRYLNVSMRHIEDLIGRGKGQRSMAEVPISDAASYAAADAEITLRLQPILAGRLQQLNAVRVFQEVEVPLIPILADMEQAGVALDIPFFKQMSAELAERIGGIEDRIQEAVGYAFNLNSTQQLSRALFETLRLSPPNPRARTSSGHFSTSAGILEEMRGQHPVIDLMLEYRELSKLRSTYVDALPLAVNPQTHRVHTSFNQTGSVTGRLASSDPNLQNIPTRTELGHRVRNGFIAGPGMLLLSVDYSQVELRIVAHMSGDQAMIDAFQRGRDIHVATAAAIFNTDLDSVSKDQRRHAKAINFGLIYGMSPYGLSRSADLTLAEAENFVKAYFQQFPRVKEYLDEVRLLAARQGYVETILGRRRYFPNLVTHSNPALRAREEREAINAPIQGTAADIIKVAMIRIPGALQAAGLKTRLLLQVHDELLFECPQDELQVAARVVQQIMEQAIELSVPLLTDARWGANWGELRPLSLEKEP